MDEARLKALYRGMLARREPVLDEAAAEDIQAVLSGYGWPAEEIGPLDRVAGSATAAAIVRTVAEIAPECDALAAAVRKARAPARPVWPRFARRSLALAASMAAVAFVFALVPAPGDVSAPVVSETSGLDIISAISFESRDAGAPQPTVPGDASRDAIFRGNFDS